MTLALIRRVEYMVLFEAAVILTLSLCAHPWRSVLLLSIWAHIMRNPCQRDLKCLGRTRANARLWIAVELQTAVQTFSLKFLVSSSQGKRTLQMLHGKPKPVLNYALKCISSCFTSGLQILLLETGSMCRCRLKDFVFDTHSLLHFCFLSRPLLMGKVTWNLI